MESKNICTWTKAKKKKQYIAGLN